MVGLRIYTVAVTAACVLQVQYQRKKTICEKSKTASSQFDCRNSRNFAYFGKFRVHFFCTLLYPLTTTQGDRFASCDNIVSWSETTSLPPPHPHLAA